MDSPLSTMPIPFSVKTVEEGRTYGPLSFAVNRQSHDKAVSLLWDSMERKPEGENPYPLLLPSELWAMARVFSLSFGRLNEVGLARAVWRLCGSVTPSSPITATAVVLGRIPKDKIAFCATRTDTLDSAGNLLMRADDKILMIHDCEKPFFIEPEPVMTLVPSNVLYHNRHRVYFRYYWDPAVWLNNIHIDNYAQICGFERGLPEFVIYMDWIFHAAMQCGWITGTPFSILLKKILPLYLDEIVDIFAYEKAGFLQVCVSKAGAQRILARVDRI